MYGIMPLEEYVANYDAILENKPFKFGNMKGKKLNKAKFFNDHSDYEVLLRKEIPDKYTKYFLDADNQPSNKKDCHNFNDVYDDIEIEYPRSNNVNLSPIKSHTEKGIKDSEVLFHKRKLSDDFDFLKTLKTDNDDTENLMKTEYTLNLGNLGKRDDQVNCTKPRKMQDYQKISSMAEQKLDVSDLPIADLDELFEKTFKKLNKNSLDDKDGKELNLAVMKMVENLKDYRSENLKLKNDINDMDLIIKDLNKLASIYKSKLKSYYFENRNLKQQLQKTRQLRDDSIPSQNNIESVESIDNKIEALQMKKKLLTSDVNTKMNVSSLSDKIVEKLMAQLKQHNNENHFSAEKLNQHQDCPFCEVKTSKDVLFSDLFSNNSAKSQEQIIDLLAEKLKSKLNTGAQTANLPEIW
ncbi:hypothetical protein CANINC_003928 [Pichia inconspicua]|uniref:Uncharacterized protein n=1 Tax=Pichia inconspicua TaxID=52247 RepID=A0A4T0WXK4_9ASCO|nr:hypothetical protein CANINC_003928 [[Candida] inconspicua]